MNIAIIVAGGSGKRISGNVKKQFIILEDKPILKHTLDKFITHPYISEIILVLPEDELNGRNEWSDNEKIVIISGGAKRTDSVYNGLLKAGELFEHRNIAVKDQYVLIHDGVRPFISDELISSIIVETLNTGGAIPVLSIGETIVRIEDDNIILDYPNREDLYMVQTPQGFYFPDIMEAYKKAVNEGFKATDDSSIYHRAGYKYGVVNGERLNIKITVQRDIVLARAILKELKSQNKGS
jgi:2-C-methyl-D-erythritol 4-phosphate cytidylyltransferase